MANANDVRIVISADAVRLARDMADARRTVEVAASGMESAFRTLKGTLGTLGIGLSAGAFVAFVKGGIDAQASLHDLALQTGITVETLSALRPIAKQAGTDLETAAGMVNKLEKNMLTFAQSGAGKAADAFKQLGYTQAQVQAGLQNMDTFLPEFAKRLLAAGLGGEQAGLAMQLMAKGGAAALPFMKQLADNGMLVAKVTTAQADAAHEFEVSLAKLKGGSTELAISLANDLLPSLNHIAEAMLEAKTNGDGFFNMIYKGAQTALTGTDLHKANEELTDLVNKKLNVEKQIENFRNPDNPGLEDRIPPLQKELALIEAQIATVRVYRNSLEELAATKKKSDQDRKPLADLPNAKGADAAAKAAEQYALREAKAHEQALQYQFDQAQEFATAITKMQADEGTKRFQDEKKLDAKELADFQAGLLTRYQEAQEFADGVVKGQNDVLNSATSVATEMTEFWKEAARTMQQSMSSLFFDVLEGNLKNLGANFKHAINRMVADVMAAKVATGLFGSEFGKGGAIGGVLGNAIDWFKSSGGGSAGSESGWNSGADLPMGKLALGTPYVPQTGLYQLHRGEAVIPAAQNARGAGPIFNVDMRGASVDAVARLERLVASVNGSIETRALGVMRQARMRGA